MNDVRRTHPLWRGVAGLTALSLAACVVPPGPMEQQAALAAQACQAGNGYACADYQSLYPAAAAERAQNQQVQDAQVGTAVAVGALGLAAGAVIAGSSGGGHHRRYYDRPYRRW